MPIGQVSKGRTSSAASIGTTGVATTASGSSYLVLCGWNNASTFSSISDTINGAASGNTWTQIGAEVAIGSNDRCRAYYVSAGFNGGTNHVVTVTVSGAVAITVLFVELTGVNTAALLTGTPSLQADTTSAFTSGNVTTTAANATLIGGIIGNSGSNPATHAVSGASPASGWTIQSSAEELDGSLYWVGALKTQQVTATGTYNAGWTESGSTGGAVLLAAFEELPPGPTITDEPDDVTAYSGQTAQFTVAATGSGSLTYQWQRATSGTNYVNVSGGSGGTSTTYTTPTLGFDENNYVYRCQVTDTNGTTNSRGARLTLIGMAPAAWLRA